MGYAVLGTRDNRYQPRKGLEGPFWYPNGRTLYYDPKAGEYWDPATDFYVPKDEVEFLQQSILDRIRGD